MGETPHIENDESKPELATPKMAASHPTGGDTPLTLELYRQMLDREPNKLSALYGLGVLNLQDGKAEESRLYLERALTIAPKNINVLNCLGAACQSAGDEKNALSYFRRALRIDPMNIAALKNISRALTEQKDYKSALQCLHELRKAEPDSLEVLIELGRCYYQIGDFQGAAAQFEEALRNHGECRNALTGMGTALWAMGHRSGARGYLQKALELHSNDAKTNLNFGEFLAFDEGKIDEALFYIDRALSLAPGYMNALWRKSFLLLAKGEYLEGWRLYANCLGDRDTRGLNRFAPLKPWDGAVDRSKHLLIWCEQGLGDSLHFIRYAKLCKERVGYVSVFCPKPLVRFFQQLPYIDHASNAVEIGEFDEHAPVMNLPHIFETVVETIPADTYLRTAPATREKWSKKFDSGPQGLKVGLVWAGGAHEDNINAMLSNLQRSIDLGRLLPILKVSGAHFYSLQMDEPATQIKKLQLSERINDLMGEVEDFADTAAIIENLDLVITVDTAVAHLAGGLGKKVWILSRYNADWRWLQNRPNNPWYPTARVFGQPEVGDWDSVIRDVKKALADEINTM